MGMFPSFFFGINNLKKTDDENEYSIVTKFKYLNCRTKVTRMSNNWTAVVCKFANLQIKK